MLDQHRFQILRLSLALGCLALFAGCLRDLVGEDPPTDKAHYPQGLTLHADGQHLLVVSTNFDLKFNRGSVLVADLNKVDAELQALGDGPAADRVVAGEKAFVGAAFLPSFGARPVITDDGKRVFMATRGANQIVELEIDGQGNLTCGENADGDGAAPSCGEAPRVLQVPANDPYHLVLTGTDPQRVDGVVTHVASNQVAGFLLDPARDDGARLRLSALWTLGEDVLGVRGVVPYSSTRGPVLLTALEVLDPGNRSGLGTALAVVDARLPQNLVRGRHNLTSELGSRSMRELAVTPDGQGLLAILRIPDGLARFSLEDDLDGNLQVHLAASTGTCRGPSMVKTFTITTPNGDVDRGALTCFDDDTVQLFDPLTLAVTDSIPFFGRGPFDVAVDAARNRIYVSYFLDDTIGIFDLVDGDGQPRLVPRGRIGTQRAKKEDGRQ